MEKTRRFKNPLWDDDARFRNRSLSLNWAAEETSAAPIYNSVI
jgi:hypothetical protein